jgi:DNA replication protein
VAERDERLKQTLAAGLAEAAAAVPLTLLRQYKSMGLTEAEAMLLVHLLAFVRHEHNDFPTIEDIAHRMTIDHQEVAELLEKLMKQGLLGIDHEVDDMNGVWFERYNLQPLYLSLAERLLQKRNEEAGSEAKTEAGVEAAALKKNNSQTSPKGGTGIANAGPSDIYSICEREFARPLSPMELETITGWLEQDRYNEELILAALKEAVFTGKLNFRYIDRILLEWQRNRVQTAEQARTYSQRFRGMR